MLDTTDNVQPLDQRLDYLRTRAEEDLRERTILDTPLADEMLDAEKLYNRFQLGGNVGSPAKKDIRKARRKDDIGRFVSRATRRSNWPDPRKTRARFRGIPKIRVSLRPGRMAISILAVLTIAHFVSPATTEAFARSIVNSVMPASSDLNAQFQRRYLCAQRTPVFDGSGTLVTYRVTDPSCKAPGVSSANGTISTPSFRYSLLSEADAANYASFIKIVEGEYSGRGTVLGINMKGILRALTSKLTGGARVGGSSPIQSGFEVLFDAQRRKFSIGEKLGYMVQAAQLAAGPLADEVRRDQFVASTMPALMGAYDSGFGIPIAGGMLSHVAFGKSRFAELGKGELCLLAAASKSPILLPGPDSSMQSIARAETQLLSIKKRAIERCVTPALNSQFVSVAEAQQMRFEIEQYRLPPILVTRSANPEAFDDVLPGLRLLITDVLKLREPDSTGVDHLAVEGSSQRYLAGRVARLMKAVSPGLLPELCSDNCSSHQDKIDVLSVAVRLSPDLGRPDQIVAAYQSRHGLWTGPLVLNKGRPHTRGEPKRAIASIAKALAIPSLAAAGVTKSCRRAWANLHDWNRYAGGDCSQAREFLSLAEMNAQSSNLAFAEAIRLASVQRITDWYRALGANVVERNTPAQLRREIASGTAVLLSPERLTRAFAAIARGAQGKQAVAVDPILLVGDSANSLTLDASTFAASNRRIVAKVLKAPIVGPSGTLRRLSEPLRHIGCEPESLYGKTGSSDAADPTGRGVRDSMVILHARCGGQSFVVFTLVGSPKITVPLTGVNSGTVGGLALDTLRAAIRTQ